MPAPEVDSQFVDALPIKLSDLRQEFQYCFLIILKVTQWITGIGILALESDFSQITNLSQIFNLVKIPDVVVIEVDSSEIGTVLAAFDEMLKVVQFGNAIVRENELL